MPPATEDGDYRPISISTDDANTRSVRAAKLCEDCSRVGITTDSFVITHKGSLQTIAHPSSIAFHKQSRRSSRDGGPISFMRSGIGDIPLADFRAIKERADQKQCKLCALIVEAVVSYSPSNVEVHEPKCSVRWEIDGHEEVSYSTFVNRTRRLRLIWTTKLSTHPREAFIVIVARNQGQAPGSDLTPRHRRAQVFQGKDIDEQGRQALIMSWIDMCHRHHRGTCDIKITHDEAFKELLRETFFGVIDVTDLQLKPLPLNRHGRPEKYVALSYVWGKPDKAYVTTRSNVPWRRQHGGLEGELNKFPVAIRDAISLVQKLNLRYLWVDAICIVQDSTSSFRLNADIMHTIYGNAYFTICAADGQDADTGLVAFSASNIPRLETLQIGHEVVPGVKLQVTRPPEMVIQDSVWNTRGWTYGERILSRRSVIFAEGRVFFQCRKAALSEDVHNDIKGSGWSLQSMGAPLRYFPEIQQRAFSFYMKSVAMFYRRHLTRPSDVLAAYKGLESILIKVMNAPFCFGLPTSHFDLALLWQPAKAMKRRVCDGQEFPSWAWSGWIGGDVVYDPAMLEGCLLNVQEWLRDHTWIRWHIVGGTGRLRPLWNGALVSEDISLEPRWRGYLGTPAEEFESTIRTRDSSSNSSPSRSPSTHSYSSSSSNTYRPDHQTSSDITRRIAPFEDDYWDHRVKESRHGEDRLKREEYRHVREVEEHPVRSERRVRRREAREAGREKATNEGNDGYGFLKRKGPQSRQAQARARLVRIERGYDEVPFSNDRIAGEEDLQMQNILIDDENERDLSRQDDDDVNSVNHIQFKLSQNSEVKIRDTWGRPIVRYSSRILRTLESFHLAHPENPYRVRRTDWQWMHDIPGYQTLNDLPILQFWTSHQRLRVVQHQADSESGLSRCHVADEAGDWCGSVLLNSSWIEEHDGETVDFIAISDAKAFTADEGPVWTYFSPQERGESEWETCYALLVQSNPYKHVWERVGLAKIFKFAFNNANWEEIMLG